MKHQALHHDDSESVAESSASVEIRQVPQSNPPKAPGNLLLIRRPVPKQQYAISCPSWTLKALLTRGTSGLYFRVLEFKPCQASF